jgi:hypothetical protein
MKDNLIDFNKFKEGKNKKSEEEYNLELFQNIITKSQEELTDGEKYVYAQIKLLYPFQVKEKFTMALVEFRGKTYIVNAVPGNKFEYIGEIEDMIFKYLGW